MTKDEKNRALAEWLEPKPDSSRCADIAWRSTWHNAYHVNHGWTHAPLDFYLSESASALLREKMPEPNIWLESERGVEPKIWGCQPDMDKNDIFALGPYLTAVADACVNLALEGK